jgi:hypothetical protein
MVPLPSEVGGTIHPSQLTWKGGKKREEERER